MRATTRDGIELSYERREGDEPTLLLLHGWANNHTVWNKLSTHVPFTTIAPDLRGHGRSSKPNDEDAYAIERFCDDVKSLLDHERIERCVLVGHSMGGMIALMTEDPRIEGLVLINSAAGIKDRIPLGPNPFLSRLARFFEEHQRLVPNDLSDAYRSDFDTFLKGLAGTSPVATISCFEAMYELDAGERLERIDTPTLVIASEDDRVLPKRFSEALAAMTNGYFETIGMSHFSLIDHAEEIAAHIESFVHAKSR